MQPTLKRFRKTTVEGTPEITSQSMYGCTINHAVFARLLRDLAGSWLQSGWVKHFRLPSLHPGDTLSRVNVVPSSRIEHTSAWLIQPGCSQISRTCDQWSTAVLPNIAPRGQRNVIWSWLPAAT